MIRSGETIDLGAALGRKVVDKHSTGGVGDKTSIAVGPIVAACGVPFGKMSGRGLGHTGGTLDKLESIPGFASSSRPTSSSRRCATSGSRSSARRPTSCPADKKLYALRDVTATVDIVPLIASLDHVEEDRRGRRRDRARREGRRRRVHEDARRRARARRADASSSARRAGREVVCLLTDMDQPLGRAVGNALEIREARRHDRAATGRRTSPSSCSTRARGCSRSPTSGSTSTEGRRRAEAAVADGARAGGATSAGSARRAATPTSARARARAGRPRGARAARRRRHAARRARGRHRGARARRGPAHEGRRDRPRGRHRLPREARRHGRSRATSSPRSTRGTTRPRQRAVAAVLAAYEIGDERAAGARHRARRRRVAAKEFGKPYPTSTGGALRDPPPRRFTVPSGSRRKA